MRGGQRLMSNEYDVQDLMHALLCLHFIDVRLEEYTPSYAGKASQMDFLLKQESIVVEIKMTRSGLGPKEVSTQLIEDIERYKVHPDCQALFCFVYDPAGLIPNSRGIEADLNRDSNPFASPGSDPAVKWLRRTRAWS
jgi:REase_DpnII-MboI